MAVASNVLDTFVDESWQSSDDDTRRQGREEDREVLCVAGYVGYSREWHNFGPKWRDAIRPLDCFHMVEFASPESKLSKQLGKRDRRELFDNLSGLIREPFM